MHFSARLKQLSYSEHTNLSDPDNQQDVCYEGKYTCWDNANQQDFSSWNEKCDMY